MQSKKIKTQQSMIILFQFSILSKLTKTVGQIRFSVASSNYLYLQKNIIYNSQFMWPDIIFSFHKALP